MGLVSLHELKQVPVERRPTTAVADIMVPLADLVRLRHDETLWRAFELMSEANVNQLPVERDGRIVGLLTRERLLGIIQSLRELDRK